MSVPNFSGSVPMDGPSIFSSSTQDITSLPPRSFLPTHPTQLSFQNPIQRGANEEKTHSIGENPVQTVVHHLKFPLLFVLHLSFLTLPPTTPLSCCFPSLVLLDSRMNLDTRMSSLFMTRKLSCGPQIESIPPILLLAWRFVRINARDKQNTNYYYNTALLT